MALLDLAAFGLQRPLKITVVLAVTCSVLCGSCWCNGEPARVLRFLAEAVGVPATYVVIAAHGVGERVPTRAANA